MRLVVISDSHGYNRPAEKAIEAQSEAKHVFFLGDGIEGIKDIADFFPDKIFHLVSGNCDFSSMEKSTKFDIVSNIGILYCHGHEQGVKSGFGRLQELAKSYGAKIVLYGHTHIPEWKYVDGIYYVNPGSISGNRTGKSSYAVIDITDNGILPIIINC